MLQSGCTPGEATWVRGVNKYAYTLQGKGKEGVKKFMEQKGLIQISDMRAIEKIVEGVLADNQQQLQEYCAGKTKLQGYFVG